ncbi:MAG: aspartyl protease family protein [Cyclobacteriaceae bacterium]|jgi:hypothetical protein|nr:aspartyl protease family protein [Cyclobacteriaceae bacterium]
MGFVRAAIIILLLTCCSLSVLAQVLGFSLPHGRTRVQFPIEVHNNLVVVPMILNGQLPLKFILDTGVRTSILTEKAYSDILNLEYTRKYTIAGPGGEKLVDAYVTNNVSFDMPGVTGRGHAMLVLDRDYLELRNYLGTDVHGILGYELFSRFIVEIDYERKLLTLMQPERFRPRRNLKSLPITIEDTKPYVHVTVVMNDSTSIDAKMLVDSGASHGIYLQTNSDPRIVVPEKNVPSIIGRGIGGVITGRIARIKELDMAEFNLPDVIASFPDPNSYVDTLIMSNSIFRNGSIGGEVLSRFTVTFNFPKERMYLKKNSEFKKDFYFNLSGLTVRAKGSRLKNFEVSDVRINSAAYKAGVKTGDRILGVNGMQATDLDLNLINTYLNNKPGKKITLQIERAGEKQKIQFRLENMI